MWSFCCHDDPPPPPPDSVDLMDTSGRLMKLQEKQDSVEPAGSVLVERRHYVLLRVHRESPVGHALCFYCERVRESSCLLQGETEQQQQCSTFLWWTAHAPATLSSQVAPRPLTPDPLTPDSRPPDPQTQDPRPRTPDPRPLTQDP